MEWGFLRAVGFYVRGMLYGVVSFLAHQYCVSSQGSWHSGLTKLHLAHQKWNRKEKTKPHFGLHYSQALSFGIALDMIPWKSQPCSH